MATRGRSRTTCPSLRITHIYAATSPMPTEATFFAMINSLCCQLLAAQLDWSHADRHASSRCTRPRAARHQRTSAPSVRICTRSGTESILGWVDQNEHLFARQPPATTTLCYLRLSATSAVGSSVSRLCGWRPRPGRAALNELSAPVLTVHDVPHRAMCGSPGRSPGRPQCGRRICSCAQTAGHAAVVSPSESRSSPWRMVTLRSARCG